MSRLAILLVLGFSASMTAFAQHTWQLPKPPRPRADIERIIGPITTLQPSKPLHILWVWGLDEWHAPGAHDYERVRDLMTNLLQKVPNTTTQTAYGFPTEAQFSQADLVCFFLHLPELSDQQFSHFSHYIESGGAVVSIHETCIMRPQKEGRKLAECLGRAWNDHESKWGAIFTDIRVDTSHPIFSRFQSKLTIRDEFYWKLFEQKQGVTPLGWVKVGPPNDSHERVPLAELSEKEWPVFWTYKRGKGRVFATSTGHHTFSYYDPEFRIILFRGMAWALREKADPFMPLVYDGITSPDNRVGTTDSMRNWKGKRRRLEEKKR